MKHHPSDSIPFTRIIRALALLAFLSTLNFNHQLSASALGTGFTYQGRLASGTNAATGLFDMRFALYDALSGGTQQGSTLTTNAVPVTNGYFAVTLDFGNWFAGSALWLDIGVKTNLAGSWTPLTPRQQLTPGPYALYSPNAGTATLANSVAAGSITSAALAPGAVTGPALAPGAVSQLGTPNGTQTNAVQVDTNGWVGVGTNSPHAGLQVSGGAGILSATVYQEVPDGTGSFTNLAGAWAVAFSTNLLAVAAETDNALTLVDTTGDLLTYRFSVANGTGPYTNLSGPVSVAFWTNRLLAVAAATNAVTLIDASTSAAPVWKSVLRDGVGEFSLLGGASAVAFNDRMLAIAAVTDNSVTLVTVTNPVVPRLLGYMQNNYNTVTNLRGPVALAFAGNLLAIAAADSNAVVLADVTNPGSPAQKASIKQGLGGFTSMLSPQAVAFSGNLLAIAAYGSVAVNLVDVASPTSPVLKATLLPGCHPS